MHYELRYPKWESASSRSGIRKAKVYCLKEPLRQGGPLVFWQFQELLAAILPPKVVPHRWFKQHGRLSDSQTWCSELEFDASDYVASRKSVKSRATSLHSSSQAWCPQNA
eukprot:1420396-Amphidinium_carterae.1